MNITCSNCKATLTVADSAAGKRGKCPKCGCIMEIPAGSPPSNSPKGTPATDRQKEYATSLGLAYPADITKSEMSQLISQAVDQRDDERFETLNALGNRESEAYEQMRKEILAEIDEEDCRLSKATPTQMLEELGQRDQGAILISFPIDEVDFDNFTGAKLDVSFSDNLSETQMRAVVLGLGSMIARQAGQ